MTGVLLLAVLAVLVGPPVSLVLWLVGQRALAHRWYRRQGLPLPPEGAFAPFVLREAWWMAVLGWYWIAGFGRDDWWDGRRRAVVCVHGFTQNGTNLLAIRRALHARGHPTRATSLGRPFQALPVFVPPLTNGLREAIVRSPDGIAVVAHSMGGIILRMALVADPQLRPYIRRVITLGTPHRGTGGAHGPLSWGPEVRALMLDAAELLDLPQLDELLPDARITTVSGGWDHVVFPDANAHIAGSEQVRLPDVGHAGLLVAPEAIEAVVQRIEADEQPS